MYRLIHCEIFIQNVCIYRNLYICTVLCTLYVLKNAILDILSVIVREAEFIPKGLVEVFKLQWARSPLASWALHFGGHFHQKLGLTETLKPFLLSVRHFSNIEHFLLTIIACAGSKFFNYHHYYNSST